MMYATVLMLHAPRLCHEGCEHGRSTGSALGELAFHWQVRLVIVFPRIASVSYDTGRATMVNEQTAIPAHLRSNVGTKNR